MKASVLVALTTYFMTLSPVAAFSVGHRFEKNALMSPNKQLSSTAHNMFGKAFSDAFSNDKSLGKVENAGLKGGPKMNENVVINGKPVKAVVGQKVAAVAGSARVRISYNCKQGDCGTCMIKMNGRKVKACQMTIPGGRCNIETL